MGLKRHLYSQTVDSMIPQRAKSTPSAKAFLEICTARAIATRMMIMPIEKTAARPTFCFGASRTVYKRFSGREMTSAWLVISIVPIAARSAVNITNTLTHDIGESVYRGAVGYGDGRAFDINGLVALTWLMSSVFALVAVERLPYRT